MEDKITQQRIETAHPKVRAELKEIFAEINCSLKGRAICRAACVDRTWDEQTELYALGRTKPGKKVTNAKAGESFHNYKLAVDIVLLIDKDGNGTYESASWETNVDFDGDGVADWIEVVTIFKKFGWEWGGDWKFKDAPHFQKAFGYSVMDLKAAVAAGKTTNGYVNI